MIPQASVAITEGTILEWLVADGARVAEGEALYVLETDKVEIEVEAPVAGSIRICGEVGQTYPVGQVIAYLEPT